MRKSAIWPAAAIAVGGLLGWIAASGWMSETFAQDKPSESNVARTLAPSKADGSVLPFPATPSASVAGPTLQESRMKWRVEPDRLKPGAPNVLIVLIDDVGLSG